MSDENALALFKRHASILITGGTGTFGRAFARYALEHFAARVCIYSRGEHAQASLREELAAYADRMRYFIGDVRDEQRLRRAMHGVSLVIHGAALKRIETGHYNPSEMIKTNVTGAINVIEAATDAGVSKVLALSSDKAFSPVSPYGQSKAMADALMLNANNARGSNGPIFAVVRYGNIWNSAGSLLPTWRACLQRGTPLRLTDPECTRFFMRAPEAVDLVAKTAATMTGGEIAIPTLPAYQLGDVLQAFLDGNDYPVNTIGLPEFEKKHESMDANRSSEHARRMTVAEIKEAIAWAT